MKLLIPGFILIDLVVTVAILGILAAIAFPTFQDYTYRAQFTEALTLTDPIRDRLARYYDYHGTFPADNAAAGLPMSEQLRGHYVQAVQVENGALQVQIQIGGTVGGLTLRPVVLAQHPYGAVRWLCGHAIPKANVIAWGEDRTDIAPNYLAKVCR